VVHLVSPVLILCIPTKSHRNYYQCNMSNYYNY
jgi:hypothetical protein